MVVKFLGARFDRLGLRFSQSLHLDGFSYKLMTGVSGKVLLIHNEGSIIPSMAAAKVSGHTLGGVFDLMEVTWSSLRPTLTNECVRVCLGQRVTASRSTLLTKMPHLHGPLLSKGGLSPSNPHLP
ncbi:vitellogenin-like [Leucoraja erinacea]|uniref:vitellogenin-like n=1 Tax=Leucoraja erinaceus TaxID=7782 RepID=UPI0024561882|nr:vitellogenin-like [Leucoraja erinacea]